MRTDRGILAFSPCPACGARGRRVRIVERKIQHIALGQHAWIVARVGVYRARCSCSEYFQAPVAGVPKGGRYSLEVRDMAARSLVRDRLPYRLVQGRFREDFGMKVSLGFIHDSFLWAHGEISEEARRQWAVERFSGVLCIDEVHDSGRTILYATDPLGDFTVHFAIVEKNDQEHMDAFLRELREMGIEPKVVITDGSPLYKDALQEVWEDVEHQLCIFHAIKEVNTLVLDALRAIKNQIRRQGNKGRKRRRGRPKRGAAKKKRRTRKQEARFLWDHQHLLVRKEVSLSEEDRQALAEMVRIAPEVKVLRRFVRDFYRLFERGITKQQARNRRTRLASAPEYRANPFLARAIEKLRKERFEKMIVFLAHGPEAQRTSNHVERNNRSFRMLQKTRYKRRQERTIRMAIELDLYARMLAHPLAKRRASLPLWRAQAPKRGAA